MEGRSLIRRWRQVLLRIAVGVAMLMIAGVALLGCSALSPRPMALSARLDTFPVADLPLRHPVRVRWNDHQVPFIEAEDDRDLAFTLGMVHAHLREAQMAMLRLLASGRLSEVAGPLTTDIDHTLRILGLGRAVPEMLALLPPETRSFLESFVAGLNYYIEHRPTDPPEYGLLGLEAEPWRIEDVLLLSRLSGGDVTWLVHYGLLKMRGRPGYPELWERLNGSGAGGQPAGDHSPLALLAEASRSGSNSIVVSGERTVSGRPLIASDPHLGLRLPNLWLAVGMKSPTFHAVGLMIPGLPFIGLGRNSCLAWGGTNMRAASSELYEVTELPAEAITEVEEEIRRRFWFDTTRSIRRSPYGPILTDSPLFRQAGGSSIALRWMGHLPSDEITAFHRAMRACTPEEFRAAFTSFGVSGQNMLFATARGEIGQVMAVRLPARQGFPAADVVRSADSADPDWDRFEDAMTLPMAIDPDTHFLVSANNRPRGMTRPVGIVFSADERVNRLGDLVGRSERLGVEELSRIQRDVYSEYSHELAVFFAGEARRHGLEARFPDVVGVLATWDGHYRHSARGPVAFELLLHGLVPALAGVEPGDPKLQIYSQLGFLERYLREDYQSYAASEQRRILEVALSSAAESFDEYLSWGDMHRLTIGHALAAIPLLGRFFVTADLPADGSRETIMKSAHGLVESRHAATYGSQSRHISDLADPDANFFVLLGGQDGWLGSDTWANQVDLWQRGEYVRLPLTPAGVEEAFRARGMVLEPQRGG